MSSPSPHDDVAEILRTLISIPSVNPMGRDLTGPEFLETRLSDWLCEFFESLGVEWERIRVAAGRDNIIARYQSAPLAPILLLDAHQDTVPVDGMSIPPFEPRISEGKIYGRGACDVKGGMAAMLWAFARLVRERPESAATVILSCSCDEEATILGITDLVRYWQDENSPSRLLQTPPDLAIIAEPTDLDVVVAHRGVVRFRLKTTGRACHSSDPTQGENAIYKMGHVLVAIEEYARQLGRFFPPDPLCGDATLSVGRIHGGMSVNIVPDGCEIEIDRRVIPGEVLSDVIPHFERFLRAALDFDVQRDPPWICCPGLGSDDNDWIAEALLNVIAEVDGVHQAVGVPYCTHASQVAYAGVPAVVFGPGSIAQAHTKDEFISIDSLQKAAEIYYRICASPPQKSDDLEVTEEVITLVS